MTSSRREAALLQHQQLLGTPGRRFWLAAARPYGVYCRAWLFIPVPPYP